MKMDQDRAVKFARSCYQTLSARMGLPDIKLNVDIREIGDKIEDIKRDLSKAEEKIESRMFIYDSFGGDRPQPSEVMVYAKGNIFYMGTTACYTPKDHTVHVTLYNDINSLMKFNREFNLPNSRAHQMIKSNSKKAQKWIASELGHALRAAGAGNAYKEILPDTFIMTRGNGKKVGLLNFDDLKSGSKNRLIEDKRLQMIGNMELSEFFEPIGVFECEYLAKGTENEFSNGYDLEEDARELKEIMDKARRAEKTGIMEASDALRHDHMIAHQAGLASMGYYISDSGKFRKMIYSNDPLFKWQPKRLVDKFFGEFWEVL